MVATRAFGEVGRYGQDLGPGQRECPVQLGEAQVIADGQPDADAIDVGDDRPVARADPVRLAVDRAVLHGDVEEVDLPVRATTVPSGARSTLVLNGRAGSPDVSASEPMRIQASHRLGRRRRTAPSRDRDRSRGRAIAVVGAAVLEILRERDEPRAGRRPPRLRARRRGRRSSPTSDPASSWTRATSRLSADHARQATGCRCRTPARPQSTPRHHRARPGSAAAGRSRADLVPAGARGRRRLAATATKNDPSTLEMARATSSPFDARLTMIVAPSTGRGSQAGSPGRTTGHTGPATTSPLTTTRPAEDNGDGAIDGEQPITTARTRPARADGMRIGMVS